MLLIPDKVLNDLFYAYACPKDSFGASHKFSEISCFCDLVAKNNEY